MDNQTQRRSLDLASFLAGVVLAAGAGLVTVIGLGQLDTASPPASEPPVASSPDGGRVRERGMSAAERSPSPPAEPEVVVLRARLDEVERELAKVRREHAAVEAASRRYLVGLERAVEALNQAGRGAPTEPRTSLDSRTVGAAEPAGALPVAEAATWTPIVDGVEVTGEVWNPGADAVAGALRIELRRAGEVVGTANLFLVVDARARVTYSVPIPMTSTPADATVEARWLG